jgi:cytochrome c oxidase cbb3-type subunit III
MTNTLRSPLLGAVTLLLVTVTTTTGCERRETARTPGGLPRTADVRQIELQPGQAVATPSMRNPYESNPSALAEGKRLYHWYNCSGCHFAGGGGIGPPLMDDDWIYGGDTQNILASIMEGRPNGMPSYRGKLPQDHALKITAYVRSLSEEQGEDAGRGAATDDTAEERSKKLDEDRPPLEEPGEEEEEEEESRDRSP